MLALRFDCACPQQDGLCQLKHPQSSAGTTPADTCGMPAGCYLRNSAANRGCRLCITASALSMKPKRKHAMRRMHTPPLDLGLRAQPNLSGGIQPLQPLIIQLQQRQREASHVECRHEVPSIQPLHIDLQIVPTKGAVYSCGNAVSASRLLVCSQADATAPARRPDMRTTAIACPSHATSEQQSQPAYPPSHAFGTVCRCECALCRHSPPESLSHAPPPRAPPSAAPLLSSRPGR